MARPHIIRADTIDLQAHEAPSAQSHIRPVPDGSSLAPHQAETLREIAAESAEENARSPRISWNPDADDIQQHATALAGGADSTMRAGAQQDALAVAQNGGQEVNDAELDGDVEVDMDDDMMDKISSSPSIEDEDIDFDFVYALHTFVATVEGQANATKGDTMVLLDDSNSYWWLVRVVKDSSIGYLPAEHIETPTERLARLNKHRNIDLSASMLGDQPDKAKNTIRTAMKRRKAKTVQFAAPTYVDYSDIDYSTEEEDAEGELFAQQQQQKQQTQQAQQSTSEADMDDESAKVEPLKSRSQPKQANGEPKRQELTSDTDPASTSKAASRAVEEASEVKAADGPKKKSDGTVRDSFFKDDTVETKKITLTPNLLRDDNAPRASNESREVKNRPSLDKLEKDSAPGKEDKKKKKEKEKDRKSGGLRGFFSRKDKKAKGEEDDDSQGKPSLDADVPEKDAEEDDVQAAADKAGPQRHPSKLQKQMPRTEPSPTRRPTGNNPRENGMDVKAFLSEGRINNVANVPPASMRLVESSPKAASETSPRDQRPDRDVSPVKSALAKPAARGEPRPAKATRAKDRVELDDFDSDEDISPEPARQAPIAEETAQQQARSPQGVAPSFEPNSSGAGPISPAAAAAAAAANRSPAVVSTAPQQHQQQQQQPTGRLSESPVQVSPVTHPPPLMVDTSSSQDGDRASPRSTPSPELIEHEDAGPTHHQQQQQQQYQHQQQPSQQQHQQPYKSAVTTMASTTTPSPAAVARPESWDDASLRAFFDSGSDIRDLLVVVYDKNHVEGDEVVAADHPVAGSLFREQNAKLAEITTRLDDMLGDWLARKQRHRGAV